MLNPLLRVDSPNSLSDSSLNDFGPNDRRILASETVLEITGCKLVEEKGMIHEDFARKAPAWTPGDRTFGLMVTAALSVTGLSPLLRHHPVRWWALLAGAIFLAAALGVPAILGPLKRLLMRFGHMVTTVLSQGFAITLLVGAFAPARLLFWLSRRNPLALRWDPKADTYWVPRDPADAPAAGMINQF
jgi:hypothetical protein